MKRVWLAFLLMVLGAGGCLPLPTPVIPTPVPATATLEPSPTIDWFPATATPTPQPTRPVVPTAVMKVGLDEVILLDDFSTPGAWQTLRREPVSAAYGKNSFTLAINGEKALVNSLRTEPVIEDAYLEMTIQPNLCSSEDTFGLMVRAASEWNGYRLVFRCDGSARVEKVRDSTATLLKDWTSGVTLPGPMNAFRVGVWMLGAEMRFFVDDVYQFSVVDRAFPSGKVGIFARSSSDLPLTVTFSDLVLTSIDAARVPATPAPSLTPTP